MLVRNNVRISAASSTTVPPRLNCIEDRQVSVRYLIFPLQYTRSSIREIRIYQNRGNRSAFDRDSLSIKTPKTNMNIMGNERRKSGFFRKIPKWPVRIQYLAN